MSKRLGGLADSESDSDGLCRGVVGERMGEGADKGVEEWWGGRARESESFYRIRVTSFKFLPESEPSRKADSEADPPATKATSESGAITPVGLSPQRLGRRLRKLGRCAGNRLGGP